MVSFEVGPVDAPIGFTLVSLHALYGKSAADRTPELQTFAERLGDRARDPDAFGRNLIALAHNLLDRQQRRPTLEQQRQHRALEQRHSIAGQRYSK